MQKVPYCVITVLRHSGEGKTTAMKNRSGAPTLVWLGWLGIIPQSETLLVQFLVRHRPRLWVLSLVRVRVRGNQSMFLSHIDVFLPLTRYQVS